MKIPKTLDGLPIWFIFNDALYQRKDNELMVWCYNMWHSSYCRYDVAGDTILTEEQARQQFPDAFTGEATAPTPVSPYASMGTVIRRYSSSPSLFADDTEGNPFYKQPEPVVSKDPLPFCTGIEFSAIYKHYSQFNYSCEESTPNVWQVYNAHIAQQLNSSYSAFQKYKVKTDGHCIEWPSPVFSDWTALEEAYNEFTKRASDYEYYPHNENVVCGGGHIHLDLPTTKDGIRLRDFVFNYPCIPWVFLQPNDTESGETPKKYKAWSNKLKVSRQATLSSLYESKDWSISKSAKPNCIELRFFEAPLNWHEQKLQLQFAYALATYASTSHNVHKPVKFYTARQMQSIKRKDAIRMFTEVCALIGVDFFDYEFLVERNLIPKWQRGYKRV